MNFGAHVERFGEVGDAETAGDSTFYVSAGADNGGGALNDEIGNSVVSAVRRLA